MKLTSRDEYLKRIDAVVARISASLAEEAPLPSASELARHANLSEFHFMRVYRALAGEPLGATIQRLRLARAVHLLTDTAEPISAIAGRIGFETPQAFAKAFRRAFGLSPSEARERYVGQAQKLVLPPHETNLPAAPAIRVDIVELQPFRVLALRNRGAYADLDQAYARLFDWLAAQNAVGSVRGLWGVPHHDRRDTPPDESLFDCCVTLAMHLDAHEGPDDKDVFATSLGGGRFIVHQHGGSYAGLDDAHDNLLARALPAQGLALREAPILHEFLNDPDRTPEELLQTKIYVPIE